MNASVILAATGLTLATCFAILQAMSLSQEFTVYANHNLTLSCQPRDSPSRFVSWYKTNRTHKDDEYYLSTGPSYTITKATVNHTTIYVCSAEEWGVWDIKTYIMVNVIVPGEPSCTHGWSLHKSACYMYSAPRVTENWHEAQAYCNDSEAQLAQVFDSREDLHFIWDLVRHRSESRFWIAPPRGADGNFHLHQALGRGRHASRCAQFNKRNKTLKNTDCTEKRPFICQRVLPEVPKDVSIEHLTSSSVQVGWTVAASSSSNTPQVYHVELTTSSGRFVSRRSTRERTLLFTQLRSNTRYRLRVQAENNAGNGSSSPYTSFKTKGRSPNIVSSVPNAKVLAGHSITLQCGRSHQKIFWYKEGSDVHFKSGHKLVIQDASSKDEGTYYCAVRNGPKGSLKVLVIEPPVITNLKGVLLKHQQKEEEETEEKWDVFILCETANRHTLEYVWKKDGEPLTGKGDSLKISLEENAAPGEYECHVTNLAGSASKSLVIASIPTAVDTKETAHRSSSTLLYLILVIVLSVLLAICCFVGVAYRNRIVCFKKKNSRKLTTQSSSTEMTPIELAVSGDEVVSRSPVDVTHLHDDVFPYEVVPAEAESTGAYKSLRRSEDSENVTQVMKPDYLNISPSNRNDSAANCMYAPLKYTSSGNDKKKRPYANIDVSGACNM